MTRTDVMSSGFQPETVPELSRYIEYMFAGLKENIGTLTDRLDRMDVVPKEQHREDFQALKAEINEIERDLQTYKDRVSSLVRWLIASVVIPIISIVVAVIAFFTR